MVELVEPKLMDVEPNVIVEFASLAFVILELITDADKLFVASVKVISFGDVVVRLFKYLLVVPTSLILSVLIDALFILYVCPVGIFIPEFAVNNPLIVVDPFIATTDDATF